MGKKVLVLTGSPRKNGNTEKMADAFIRGAEAAGHTVTKFEGGIKKVGGCRACNNCWSKGRACVFDDDFTELSELLENNEVLLISSPLYWFGFPAQVKSVIDRLYAYSGSGGPRPLGIKESMLFICGGDATEEQFRPTIGMYEGVAQFLGWKDSGIIQTGGLDAEGAIEASGILKQAEDMGRAV